MRASTGARGGLIGEDEALDIDIGNANVTVVGVHAMGLDVAARPSAKGGGGAFSTERKSSTLLWRCRRGRAGGNGSALPCPGPALAVVGELSVLAVNVLEAEPDREPEPERCLNRPPVGENRAGTGIRAEGL